MLEGAFLSVDDITAVVWVEVAGIAEDFKEAANTLLSLFLCFFLHVNRLMCVVQVSKNAIY